MKECLELFLTFAKIGSLMFGGGYSMLPLLTRELVDRKKWASEEDLMNYFAIAQCTPGVIAVNTATFIGNKRKGVVGGIAATLGVVFVPLLLILVIAMVLSNFWQNEYVGHAFSGIRVAVAALILSSAYRLARNNIKRPLDLILCLAAFAVTVAFHVSTVYIVVVVAALGLILYWGGKKA